MKNNDGAGGTQAKGGGNAAAIQRPTGYAQAVGAVTNKTRTKYPASAKHYHYEGCGGYGANENIVGYEHGRPPGGYVKHY